MVRKIIIGILAVGISSCAYPVSETIQGSQNSAIYFEAFPPTATVMVNGVVVGVVSDFDGVEQSLAVPEGTSAIVISDGQRTLLDKKVFVGRNSTQKITR